MFLYLWFCLARLRGESLLESHEFGCSTSDNQTKDEVLEARRVTVRSREAGKRVTHHGGA